MTLIERLETATGDSYDLMLLAFKESNPYSMCWDFDEGQAYEDKKLRFIKMLLAGAYESAALTLVPEGWSYTVAWLHRNGRAVATFFHAMLREQCAEAPTLALAICIAAIKAKGEHNA